MALLKNRVGIVTGAATGNGETIARTLYREGAAVVLVGHDGEGLKSVANSLDETNDRIAWIEGDVRDQQTMQRAVELARNRFGGLNLAVNNVGVTGPAGTLLEELTLEDWEEVISTDLTGMFLSLKAELPAMVAGGGGAIVNLSSANGVVGVPGIAAYTCAKHGVVGLTRSAALEYASKGVRVNCIGPGYVSTPRMNMMPGDALDALAALHPMGRLATRQEVADFVVFLLSEKAGFCTGGFYPLDGGYTAQ